MSIKADGLSKAISDALSDYQAIIAGSVSQVVEEVGKSALADVKAHSPVREKGGGAYQKSWSIKSLATEAHRGAAVVVYNKKYYRLTHLLENGHALRNGDRSRKFPHIKPAEERAIQDLEAGIKRAIEEAGL